MSFAKVYSAQAALLDASIIDVEVDLSPGLHAFAIVGLPDKAVEEARDRVSSAIKNSGFKSPKSKNQKIVIALAPADLKKEGANFDLAMALAYLLAADEIKFSPEKQIFLGELSLDGKLRPINGSLPLVRWAKSKGFTRVFLPKENAREAALIDGIEIYGAASLDEVVKHIDERCKSPQRISRQPKTEIVSETREHAVDLSDIKRQETAKRGLEIAAAGGHNLAMYGPPGTGKTMLARAFASLLPPLSFEEILEVTSIHSVAGVLRTDLVTAPPLRTPHHTASHVAIVGGGSTPKPGEITLSHRGVLFLDEFPEFEHRVIEVLRQPLEDRQISISRVKGSATYPAHFILIAAMNPCPCGNFGSRKACICSPSHLMKYRRKISGPIIDRIDMWVEVGEIEYKELSDADKKGEGSDAVKARVLAARDIQLKRFKRAGFPYSTNAELKGKDIDTLLKLDADVRETLNSSAERLGLSGRAYHRVLKLARTIADLSKSETVRINHIMEALSYRPKQLNIV